MSIRNGVRLALPHASASARLVARRSASGTTETIKAKAAHNRTGIIYSATAVGVIIAGVYLLSPAESEKRKRAIAKINRVKHASAVPSAVAAKASEAKEKSPPLDGSSSSSEDDEGSDQEAAFNPETGEINWDCPCLGGMAHGTCGEQFKEAFSCFVFSEAEPKGIDCVDKFNVMQACFRENPKEYAEVIKDDEEADEQAPDGEDPSVAKSELQHKTGGATGLIDAVKQEGKNLKDKAEKMVDRTREAIDGNPSVKPPKHEQEHNEGKALKQPKGGEDDHRSTHSSGVGHAGSGSGSGYDEGSPYHLAHGAGSSSNFAAGTEPGKGEHSLDDEKTTNKTKGESAGLGRNAAEGSKPSGSQKAHEQHKEGVEKTRSGSEKRNSRENLGNRG